MHWKRPATWLLLLSAWAGLGLWQYSEYRRTYRLAFDEFRREAELVNGALVGGIRTHRRMGRFFEENLQEALDQVAESDIVLAVGVESSDGKRLAAAGDVSLLEADPETLRRRSVFPFHAQFELQPSQGGGRGGWGFGGRGSGGRGQGGRGRGAIWQEFDEPQADDSFAAGGTFTTVFLLDVAPTELRCRQEARLRGLVVVAGCSALLCAALMWQATVRTATARGRARLFETETQHLRELSQAAAGLAHETRNPLGLIRGWTQRLAERCDDQPDHREQARAIVEECDRVTARINQFLAFARPSEPHIETITVAEVVEELAVLLEPDFDAKDLTLDRSQVGADATVEADREMLRQMLFNLVQNAVQFSPDGSTIELAVRRNHGGARRIEVSDCGPGVPEEAVDSLFTPYFTSRSDGTGLGLAIVRRLAKSHGWRTGYTPRPGGGSVFWLEQAGG